MKLVVEKIGFMSINCDEVTTLDNQCWIFVYAYIVEDQKKVLIHLNLAKVVDGATFDYLNAMIGHFLIVFGGFLEMDIVNKVVSFGVDRVIVL